VRKYLLDKNTKKSVRWKDIFQTNFFCHGVWALKSFTFSLNIYWNAILWTLVMSRLFTCAEEIILASGSPRRRAYLEELGVFSRAISADIEERKYPAETSVTYIERLAREKAGYVAERCPGFWVVAADTVVCLDDMVLEKPLNEDDAVDMLLRLSGREHIVRTAVCLQNQAKSVCDISLVSTGVSFWEVTEEMIRAYVRTGEPMDKAGSYGIQGKGAFMVREIHGSYSNVVGLPLYEFLGMLNRYKLLGN